MAISVTDIGHNSNSSGTTVAVVVIAGGVPAGALIVVGTGENAAVAGSVADTKNTYSQATSALEGGSSSNGNLQIFYSANVLALTSANSITFTKGSTSNNGLISTFYATGIAPTSPLDTAVTASDTAGGRNPSVTSGTPAIAGELFVGFTTIRQSGATYTQDTTNGWAAPFAVDNTQGSIVGGGGNQVNAGTGTKIFAPSWSGGSNSAAVIVGFKAGVVWQGASLFAGAGLEKVDATHTPAGSALLAGAGSERVDATVSKYWKAEQLIVNQALVRAAFW